MLTGLKWLVALACLNSVTSCAALGFGHKRPVQPPREVCLIGNAGCVCFDSRLSAPPVDTTPISCGDTSGPGVCYIRSFAGCLNYMATNAVDYDAQQAWISTNCLGPRGGK